MKILKTLSKTIVLKNAIEYGGKSRTIAPVIAKTMALRPDLRNNLKNLIPEITGPVVQKSTRYPYQTKRCCLNRSYLENLNKGNQLKAPGTSTTIRRRKDGKCDYKIPPRAKWLSSHWTCQAEQLLMKNMHTCITEN